MKTIKARMKNPAVIIPEAMEPIKALYASAYKGGLPPKTISLVHLRVSQINGCSSCVAGGSLNAKQIAPVLSRAVRVVWSSACQT